MLNAVRVSAGLTKNHLSRSLPAFSTSCKLLADQKYSTPPSNIVERDPYRMREAPIIDNECIISLPDEAREKWALESCITVSTRVDITPVSGVPEEHIRNRRVRIYQPTKNAMQSGTCNINHWEMEFENRQRWENPCMGWTSTGDPLSNMKVQFQSPAEAIEHCEKNGWKWFLDTPRIEKPLRPKDYSHNFAWNRRTRVSTK